MLKPVFSSYPLQGRFVEAPTDTDARNLAGSSSRMPRRRARRHRASSRRARHGDAEGQRALGTEAMIARANLLVAAQQEQRRRRTTARRAQSRRRPAPCATGASRGSAVTRCWSDGTASRPNDGSSAGDERGQHRDRHGEERRPRGEADLVRAGKVRGQQLPQQRQPGAGEEQAERRRRPRQSPGSPRGRRERAASDWRRARGASESSSAARHGARHRQAGDVGAGHEQHQAARRHQQPHDLARSAGDLAGSGSTRARQVAEVGIALSSRRRPCAAARRAPAPR